VDIHLRTPLGDSDIRALSVGDSVYLSGVVYTARDAAHKRIYELLKAKGGEDGEGSEGGEGAPFPFAGQVVYYAGPCPAGPGRVIGSIGPTTSGRMDRYAPTLMAHGLRCMIGKGRRSDAVLSSIVRFGGVYFIAVGGAAALMSRCVTGAEVVAFPELGTEAVRALTVVDFPLVVGIDAQGRDIYKRGIDQQGIDQRDIYQRDIDKKV